MKKIDVLLLMELFNIRNLKKYKRSVVVDFCSFVREIISCSDNYIEFINNFDYRKMSYTGNDFVIRCEFSKYLKKVEPFICHSWH